MKKIVLKPCPFCGGKPLLVTWPLGLDKEKDDYQCAIECQNPRCKAEVISSCFEECSIHEEQWKQEMIKRWNTRKDIIESPNEQEPLCAKCGELCQKCGEEIAAENAHRVASTDKGMDSKLLFQVGDKIKLRDDPFDDQLESERQKYSDQKDKIQIVQETKEREDKRGFLIKTDISNEWIHQFWYEKAEQKPPLKLRVGGHFVNRNKNLRTIIHKVKHTADDSIIYQDNHHYWYREDGKYLQTSNDESQFDLIEEVQPEKQQNSIDGLYYNCDKCGAKRISNTMLHKCKATVAEKEAVECCECVCDGARFYYSITPDICGICKNPFNEKIQEKENLKYRRRFADYLRKATATNCAHIIRLEDEQKELRKKLETEKWVVDCYSREIHRLNQEISNHSCKPDGNPFKVGEVVLVDKQETGKWKGKIYEINPDGETMKIAMEDLSGRFTWNSYIGTYHYKQCELCEDQQ